MTFDTKTIGEKRAKHYADAKAIADRAQAEERDLTADENRQIDEHLAQIDVLKADERRAQKLEAEAAHLSKPEERRARPEEIGAVFEEVETEDLPEEPEWRKRFIDSEVRKVQMQRQHVEKPSYRDAWFHYMARGLSSLRPQERRDLEIGVDAEGGYLIPTDVQASIIRMRDTINVMRSAPTQKVRLSHDRNFPVESAIGAAVWIDEEGSFLPAVDPVFGQVSMSAYKLGTIVKVSEELLADSPVDLSSYIGEIIGRRFGLLEEAAFVNGDGTLKPSGIVAGVTEDTDAFASNSAITADELIDLHYGLPRQYRQDPATGFLMRDTTVATIRKLLINSQVANYAWQPGLKEGEPDMLLGKRVYPAENVPAIGSNAVSVVLANLSYYMICDRGAGVFMQRLDELYAETGQVGFRAYARVDGKMTVANAGRGGEHAL